jgi:hypothetical protein
LDYVATSQGTSSTNDSISVYRNYPFLFVAGKLANRYEIIDGMGFWYLPLPYTDISHDE